MLALWRSPATYLENFKLHARRLRAAAEVLKDHGQRLGLEYVGTKTSREPVVIHSSTAWPK